MQSLKHLKLDLSGCMALSKKLRRMFTHSSHILSRFSSAVDDDDSISTSTEQGKLLAAAQDFVFPDQYDPSEYANLKVDGEVQELFGYIGRYKPHCVDLQTQLKPFVPDFMPAVDDVDGFIKIPRPDGKESTVGLARLDEPCLNASDPTVLDLQLRSLLAAGAEDD